MAASPIAFNYKRSSAITTDNMHPIINHKKGYTLLFSIIVASIVLSIAAFILSVSRKQFILASAARDSTVAIYAADSGIQCAVEAYTKVWLATTSPATINCYASSRVGTYNNDAGAIPEDTTLLHGDSNGQTFKTSRLTSPIILPLQNNTCATVDVMQGYYQNGATYSHRTIIDSRGYNIADSGPCDLSPSPNPVNPRAVERAIRLQYND